MANLDMYGPYYSGFLQQKGMNADLSAQNTQQGMQALGLLSNMQGDQMRNRLLQQQANMAEARFGQEQAAQGLLSRLYSDYQTAITPRVVRDDIAGTDTTEPGMPEHQAQKALFTGMMQNPALAQLGMQGLTKLEATTAASEDRKAAREQRIAEIQMKLADAATSRQEQAELRKELFNMQAANQQQMVRLAASLRPPRQEPQPQVVQTDTGPMILDRSGQARPIVGPDGQPVKGKSTERALPTSAAAKLMENQQNLRRAEQALALVRGEDIKNEAGEVIQKGDKNATGWKGFLPDFILQRTDPSGVPTRASIADLGSLIVHDRSGAAVTAAEFPRLRPFIPSANDDPKTAETKLARFVDEYRKVVEEAADFYKESGYKVPTGTLRPSGAGGLPSASEIDAELARRGKK